MPRRPDLLTLPWPQADRFAHWVGGALCPGKASANTRQAPAHPSQCLAWLPEGGPEEVALAMASACKAFPAWKALGPVARGERIGRAAELLRDRQELIAQVLAEEVGKPLAEARAELARAAQAVAFAAGEGTRLGGVAMPGTTGPHSLSLTLREPLGVAALFTPWNFPASILAWKLAPALVAGNTVVLKPSPLSPGTSWMILDLFLAAGVPHEAIQLVWGGAEAGQALASHPQVAVASFTGSTAVGRQVQQAVARQGGRCVLEMGGKNPVVVLADADLDLAAEAIAQGAWGSAGQRCNATSRVIVAPEVHGALVERLVAQAKALVLGDPLDASTTMGPMAEGPRMMAVLAQVKLAEAQGAQLLCGGQRVRPESAPDGHFLAPTLLDGLVPGLDAWHQELFGPVLGLCVAHSEAEALALANDTPYGLASSIFTRDHGAAMRFVHGSQVGMVHVNQSSTFSEAHLPFGGWKDSGFGFRESGATAIEPYLQWKSAYLSP